MRGYLPANMKTWSKNKIPSLWLLLELELQETTTTHDCPQRAQLLWKILNLRKNSLLGKQLNSAGCDIDLCTESDDHFLHSLSMVSRMRELVDQQEEKVLA